MPTKKIITIAITVNLLLLPSLSFASDISNVKDVPKNFIGKWAGMHSTKQKLTKTILEDLCNNGGEQDTSFFVDFDSDGQRITNVAYWEDLTTEYPVSYSKHSANQISGQSLSISFEMGSDDTLSSKTYSKFDYKISGNKLYVGTGADVIEMMRCQ